MPLERFIEENLAKQWYREDAESARDAYTYDYGESDTQEAQNRRRRSVNYRNAGNAQSIVEAQSTLTQVLIDSTKPALMRWVSHDQLLDIEADNQDADAIQSQAQLEGVSAEDLPPTREKRVRDGLPETFFNDVVTTLLLYGLSGTLINDVIRPTVIDPVVTAVRPEYICTSLMLTGDDIDRLRMLFAGGEEVAEPLFPIQNSQPVEVKYGNCEYEGATYRFFRDPQGALHTQQIPVRDLNHVIWDTDHYTRAPIGVYGKVRAFEPKWEQRWRKKNKIIANALEADILVEKGLLPSDKAENYGDSIVEIERSGADSQIPIEQRIYTIPNKVELLSTINDELVDLETRARQLTGLVELTNLAQDMTQRTATEVSIDFYRATTTIKSLVDMVAHLIDLTFKVIGLVFFREEWQTKLRKNPLELEQEVAAANALFADLMALHQMDPQGTNLGGAVDAKAISETLKIRARAAGLDPSIFDLNFQAASVNAEMQAEQAELAQQRDVAQLHIQAETATATSQVAIAETEKVRAQASKYSNDTYLAQQEHALKVEEHRAKVAAERAKLLVDIMKASPEAGMDAALAALDRIYGQAA